MILTKFRTPFEMPYQQSNKLLFSLTFFFLVILNEKKTIFLSLTFIFQMPLSWYVYSDRSKSTSTSTSKLPSYENVYDRCIRTDKLKATMSSPHRQNKCTCNRTHANPHTLRNRDWQRHSGFDRHHTQNHCQYINSSCKSRLLFQWNSLLLRYCTVWKVNKPIVNP